MNGTERLEGYNGRWYEILVALGVPEESLDGKHHPCPVCGGTDRFRFDDQDGQGTWFCGQHMPKQAGYGLQLVQELFGCSVPEAFNKINSIIGTIAKAGSRQVQPKHDPKIQLNRLWAKSVLLTGSDPISRYLHSRGLVLNPENVRYCETCFESDSKTYKKAMVALIQGKDGKPVSLHRTYAGKDKNGKRVKKIMTGTGPLNGAAIQLARVDGIKLGVAEGIETAMAAQHLFNVSCWSVINSVLMGSFVPPARVRHIVIYGDNDYNYTGQQAAYTLAKRLHNEGLIVEVKIPTKPGDDFANVWLRYREQQKEK